MPGYRWQQKFAIVGRLSLIWLRLHHFVTYAKRSRLERDFARTRGLQIHRIEECYQIVIVKVCSRVILRSDESVLMLDGRSCQAAVMRGYLTLSDEVRLDDRRRRICRRPAPGLE